MDNARTRLGEEQGSGMLATVAGVAVFLGFLLLAVQVAVHLYATTVVTAAAFDAARIASGSGSHSDAQALEHARGLLGRWASEVDLSISRDGEDVVVDVRGSSPAIIPRTLGGAAGIGDIERSIRVRAEEFR